MLLQSSPRIEHLLSPLSLAKTRLTALICHCVKANFKSVLGNATLLFSRAARPQFVPKPMKRNRYQGTYPRCQSWYHCTSLNQGHLGLASVERKWFSLCLYEFRRCGQPLKSPTLTKIKISCEYWDYLYLQNKHGWTILVFYCSSQGKPQLPCMRKKVATSWYYLKMAHCGGSPLAPSASQSNTE